MTSLPSKFRGVPARASTRSDGVSTLSVAALLTAPRSPGPLSAPTCSPHEHAVPHRT
eukprot:CAMPEP_0183357044 /NCGR_PEP_ID=MMETSP0164_2-20130417/45347_1 /TAXON_ID=221442 /ORGANISM="Coccolithus pelagicus ssp braarudi, Strain PLY182g" /LENGTH=56 /DNA_ID=CAMNT_0025530589 /DNA_START=125 /DNA_END=295 /DNA_ORIENTATION=+